MKELQLNRKMLVLVFEIAIMRIYHCYWWVYLIVLFTTLFLIVVYEIGLINKGIDEAEKRMHEEWEIDNGIVDVD